MSMSYGHFDQQREQRATKWNVMREKATVCAYVWCQCKVFEEPHTKKQSERVKDRQLADGRWHRQKKTNLYIHLVLAILSISNRFLCMDRFVYVHIYGKMFKGRSLQVYLEGIFLLFSVCLTTEVLFLSRKVCRVPFDKNRRRRRSKKVNWIVPLFYQ